jgi:hypothetical protein
MTNRIATAISNLAPRVDALDPEAHSRLDASMAVDAGEHFAYQNEQSRAFVGGKLTRDEALIVYNALGEVGSESNGGWASGTDLTTKVVVTKLMGELIGARMGVRV